MPGRDQVGDGCLCTALVVHQYRVGLELLNTTVNLDDHDSLRHKLAESVAVPCRRSDYQPVNPDSVKELQVLLLCDRVIVAVTQHYVIAGVLCRGLYIPRDH